MILSDADILLELKRGNLICSPFDRPNLSNSSIDLRLDDKLIQQRSLVAPVRFDIDDYGKLTPKNLPEPKNIPLIELGLTSHILRPNEFVLGKTLEYVGSNCDHIIGQVCDKSTLARLGLSICFSAGYIDAGNALNITLEIKNNGHMPIELSFGMHICQIKFIRLSSPCINKYDGKYLNSRAIEVAR